MKKCIALSILCITFSLWAADNEKPDAFLEEGKTRIWLSEHGKQKVRDNISDPITLYVKMHFFERSGQNAAVTRPKKISLSKEDSIDIPDSFTPKKATLILSATTQAKIRAIHTPRSIILVAKESTSCTIQ